MYWDVNHNCNLGINRCKGRLRTMIRRRFRIMAMLLVFCAALQARAANAPKSVFPNPGLANPRMNFNIPTRVNGVDHARMSPYLPAIPGPLSGWTVNMWHRREVLNARELVRNDRQLRDPRLGLPAYAFITPNAKTYLAIYRDHKAHRWVYDLFEKNGRLLPNGGANILLQANTRREPITMNHPLIYNLWAKIAQANIHYDNPQDARNGAVIHNGVVLAQILSGFILQCQSPNPADRITLFLQIPLSDSRSGPSKLKGGVTYKQGSCGAGGISICENITPPGGCPLPFHSQRGPLRHLRFNLNEFLRKVLANPPIVAESGGTAHRLVYTDRQKHLKNWTLGSMYVGLETENRDYWPGTTDHHPQGSVSVALQIAGLSVLARRVSVKSGEK